MPKNDNKKSYAQRKKEFKDGYNNAGTGILTARGAWQLHQRQEDRRHKTGEMYPPN